MKAQGRAARELEATGGDASKEDREGSSREDTWFVRGGHGWFDRLLNRFRRRI
jgi:hypothetical protein